MITAISDIYAGDPQAKAKVQNFVIEIQKIFDIYSRFLCVVIILTAVFTSLSDNISFVVFITRFTGTIS